MGPQKAKAWRDSDKLLSRPDPVTGVDEDPFKEYKILKEWTRHSETDERNMTVSSEGCDVSDETLQQLQNLQQGNASSSDACKGCEDVQTPVKTEAISEEEKDAAC